MIRWRSLATPLTKQQLLLWLISLICILIASVFGKTEAMTLIASLIGATSLIFAAKRNLLGPLLMIVFSLLYGIISFWQAYYGEVITYLCMTLPMSALSLVAWSKNPVSADRPEVRIHQLTKTDVIVMSVATVGVTVIFYYILARLHTSDLGVSTLSVSTSFVAAYLTWRRSPWYAIGYALNDLVLIVLWLLASAKDSVYGSMVVCFAVFFVNDVYGFVCWRRSDKAQHSKLAG